MINGNPKKCAFCDLVDVYVVDDEWCVSRVVSGGVDDHVVCFAGVCLERVSREVLEYVL